MDTTTIVLIIVGIVLVAVIVVAAVVLGRRRKAEADRKRAAELREKAQVDELEAREREAIAAHAEADAKEAEVNAERLRREAADHASGAADVPVPRRGRARRADSLEGGAHRHLADPNSSVPAQQTVPTDDDGTPAHDPRHAGDRIGGDDDTTPPRPARTN